MYDHLRPFTTIYDHLRPSKTIYDHLILQPSTTLRPSLTIYDHIRPSKRLRPSTTKNNNKKPLRTLHINDHGRKAANKKKFRKQINCVFIGREVWNLWNDIKTEGLYVDASNTSRWLNETELSENWFTHEPNGGEAENCAIYDFRSRFHDVACTRWFKGLCSIDVTSPYFLRGDTPFDDKYSWTGNEEDTILGNKKIKVSLNFQKVAFRSLSTLRAL